MSLLDQRFASERNLLNNLGQFCALLRSNGVSVGMHEEIAAAQCLEHIQVKNSQEFKNTLALALAKSSEELAIFERLFGAFWFVLQNVGERSHTKETDLQSNKRRTAYRRNASILTISEWLNKNSESITEDREAASYSPYDSLGDIDFADIPEHQFSELSCLLRQTARRLAIVRGRRWVAKKKKSRLDIRTSIRKNIGRSEIIGLSYKTRKLKNPRLLLLLDVSRSMELYSMFLLNFIHAFQYTLKKSDCFVFSTKILKLPEETRRSSFEDFREAISDVFPEWSGGTRIGECLDSFEREYSEKHVTKQTTVMILSDGWDCGGENLLPSVMRRLKTKAKRIVWLNPLMGFAGYEPKTGAIQGSLPYIDLLHSAHNVTSLEKALRLIV